MVSNNGPSNAEDVLLFGDLFQIVLNLLFPAMKQRWFEHFNIKMAV